MADRPSAAAQTALKCAPDVASEVNDQVVSCTQLLVRVRPPGTGCKPNATPRARLLLVDDEPQLRRWLARQLTGLGYHVDCAASGQEAVAYVDQYRYDVIVSDIRMPQMDGIELLREVRRHDLDVPVVLLTGAPAVGTAMQALEHGAFRYLAKSTDIAELEQVLDRATHLKRISRQNAGTSEPASARPDSKSSLRQVETRFDRCLQTLWVAYHPIVDATTRELHGHEALLRSSEPSLPHPGAVLDAAHKLGRLDELGRTIRGRASEAFVGTNAPGLLFVNMHVTDLADPALYLPDAPLSTIAERVILELTERASLDEVRDASKRVARLREMGFRVAVDDMGAGYAGLASFGIVQPEYVKLDMSLVRDVHLSATNQKVIRSMTALCSDLGMKVVAEGVETVEERDMLLEVGCKLLQGFLFAKPGKAFPKVQW